MCYDSSNMKLFTILRDNKKHESKNEGLIKIEQSQKDTFIQIGREQFKKLQKLGLQIPIAVL